MSLFDSLAYVASLPERALRSLAAGVGGVSKLLTDSLLPPSLRKTQFYTYLLGNTQRFIIEGLGGVEGAYAKEAGGPLPENYVAKKVVGNVADAAGMFAFHMSPLWFFALVGDAAGGTKLYLQRIVGELKKDGVLAPGASIGSAEQLLDALTSAAAKTAMPLDTPPLSKEELAKLRDEIRGGYAQLYEKSKAVLPDPELLWTVFAKVRETQAVPFLQLSGAMALAGAKAAGKATGDLFWEKVVRSYGESLDQVRLKGFGPFFAEATAPYLEAVVSAFAPEKATLTEKLLSGGFFRRGPA